MALGSASGYLCRPPHRLQSTQAPAPRPPRSAGWLPPAEAVAIRNLLRLDLRAQHVGTAQLRMHAWLLGLRAAIGNTNARCVLDETKRVVVVASANGEGGGIGQGPAWKG